MNITILSNGAQIHKFGLPKLFLMAGVHGEEIAPITALEEEIKQAHTAYTLENIWILPCLNVEAREQQNRFYRGINLNGEFKEESNLPFMRELVGILKQIDIEIFVDMHEDVDAYCDYIWTTFKNPTNIDDEVREFCNKQDVGMTYQPDVEFYRYTSGDFGERQDNIQATYTTETMQYAPIKNRIKRNIEYIEFFKSISQNGK
jgi:succinylglutamate desuccinylase